MTHPHTTDRPLVPHTGLLLPRARSRRYGASVSVAAVLTALALAGCSGDSQSASSTADDETSALPVERTEVARLAPRALVADVQGRLTLIDTETGEQVGDGAASGFVRLSDAGDGRHVVVADGDRFRFFDTGIESEEHGDHDHRTAGPGSLLEATREASKAGHAVPHAGWTALFSDGDGEIDLVRTTDLTDLSQKARTLTTSGAHHGVAVRLQDGSVATTWGTEEKRSGLRLVRNGEVLAQTDACPGVHGEATAAPDKNGDVLAFGCEDGPVVLRDGEFHKVDVPHDYLRTGNIAGHPEHPVVLTDHKRDPDAELERPTTIGLLDTRTDRLREVDLGSSYWFRSLGRGADGEAIVLTYDGSLRVIDPETGKELRRIEAIGAWSENDDWQEPGPVLEVVGDHAYVADAKASELVVIDLTSGEVEQRHALPADVVELVVTTGAPEHEVADQEADHDHAGHDHDH